jgi:hypothetical protein
MSKIPHFPDNGSQIAERLTLRADRALSVKKIMVFISVSLNEPQGHDAAGRMKEMEKFSCFIGNQTRGILTCLTVPEPNTINVSIFF